MTHVPSVLGSSQSLGRQADYMRAPNSVHSQQVPANLNCKFLSDTPSAL